METPCWSARSSFPRRLRSHKSLSHDNYGAASFSQLNAWEESPRNAERPLSVPGLISIWQMVDQGPFNAHIGAGVQTGEEIKINQQILKKVVARQMPPEEVILYFADYISTDCEAPKMFWETLIVEPPRAEQQEFVDRPQKLPDGIDGFPLSIEYYNGSLPNSIT